MNNFEKILTYFDGKKTTIQGIIALTASYLVFRGIFVPETAAFINGIGLIVFGSASVATTSMKNNAQLAGTTSGTPLTGDIYGENSGTTL